MGIATDPGVKRAPNWQTLSREKQSFDILKPISNRLIFENTTGKCPITEPVDLDHIIQLARYWNTNYQLNIQVFLKYGAEITHLRTETCGKEPHPVLLRLNESRWEAVCHFDVPAEQLSATTKPEPKHAENTDKNPESTAPATSERPRGELQDNTNDTTKSDSTPQTSTTTEKPDEIVVENLRNGIAKLALAVANLSEAAIHMDPPRRAAIQPSIDALYFDFREVTKDGLVAFQ